MSDQSMLEIARSRYPGRSDEELMTLLAAELVAEIGLEPPLEPKLVASWQGVSRVELCDIPWAGCLLTENGELVVKLCRDDPSPRRRFTAFHEIAHTFLPGFRTTTRYRCTPGTVTRDRDEHLCDLAASEMLLPAAHIRPRLTGPLRLESAEALATDFDASLEASCRRIVTLWPAPALLVGLELRTSPRQKPGAEPRLRVASQHANGDWPYAPKHKSLQPGHALYDVLAQGTITCETDLDDLWPPDRRGRLTIHAGHYPWTDRDGIHHDRVLVLASEPGRITP